MLQCQMISAEHSRRMEQEIKMVHKLRENTKHLKLNATKEGMCLFIHTHKALANRLLSRSLIQLDTILPYIQRGDIWAHASINAEPNKK